MRSSEKFWDRLSKNYDGGDKKENKIHNMTVEHMLQYLESNDTVLDFACATGQYSRDISHMVKKIHAIDYSPKMIEVAKLKAEENNIINIDFQQTTIFDKTLKEGSFNVILGFNIFHLLVDYQNVIQRINSLLKVGGLFISSTPCIGEDNVFIQLLFKTLSKIGIAPNISFFTTSELDRLISKTNFDMIEIKNLDQSDHNHFVVAKKI